MKATKPPSAPFVVAEPVEATKLRGRPSRPPFVVGKQSLQKMPGTDSAKRAARGWQKYLWDSSPEEISEKRRSSERE